MFGKTVLAARLVLGIFYLLSGFNWFFGFIPFLPHVGMPADLPIKHQLVVEMIDSGWMFQSAKIVELLFGAALLTNRAVPLMLAVALPVASITFMLDALILDDIMRWLQGAETGADLLAAIEDMIVGGLCVLLPHLWLMWAYFGYYRPAMAWRAEPVEAWHGGSAGATEPLAAQAPASAGLRRAFFAFGWFAIALQAFNLYLFISVIRL